MPRQPVHQGSFVNLAVAHSLFCILLLTSPYFDNASNLCCHSLVSSPDLKRILVVIDLEQEGRYAIDSPGSPPIVEGVLAQDAQLGT